MGQNLDTSPNGTTRSILKNKKKTTQEDLKDINNQIDDYANKLGLKASRENETFQGKRTIVMSPHSSLPRRDASVMANHYDSQSNEDQSLMKDKSSEPAPSQKRVAYGTIVLVSKRNSPESEAERFAHNGSVTKTVYQKRVGEQTNEAGQVVTPPLEISPGGRRRNERKSNSFQR